MPVSPRLATPTELAAQTTKSLQKLLARSSELCPRGKGSPLETPSQTVVT